jgi:hypothetical protein
VVEEIKGEDEASEASVSVVPGPALPWDGVQPVVMELVETVARVWVQRKEDEAKMGRMMADLAGTTARLAPVRPPAVGCVYGARFTEDNVKKKAHQMSKEQASNIGLFSRPSCLNLTHLSLGSVTAQPSRST